MSRTILHVGIVPNFLWRLLWPSVFRLVTGDWLRKWGALQDSECLFINLKMQRRNQFTIPFHFSGTVSQVSTYVMSVSSTRAPYHSQNLIECAFHLKGYGEQYDQMVIYGDLKSYKFCVLYTKANRILAALTCSCDPLASKLSFDIGDRNAAYGPTGPTYIKDVFPDPPVVQ